MGFLLKRLKMVGAGMGIGEKMTLFVPPKVTDQIDKGEQCLKGNSETEARVG